MAKEKTNMEPSWQTQKSSLARDSIIIATLKCIVEYGYQNTTMSRIAASAKLSPGAMQYHFPKKMDVIKAAVSYLHVKRLNDHQKDLREIPEGVNPMAHSIEVYWRHLIEGHFIAYQDLVMAARVDPVLSSVLKPAYQRFVKAWRRDAIKLVPGWSGTPAQLDLIFDVAQAQLEGLAFASLNNQLPQKQIRSVLEFTKTLLGDLMGQQNAIEQVFGLHESGRSNSESATGGPEAVSVDSMNKPAKVDGES